VDQMVLYRATQRIDSICNDRRRVLHAMESTSKSLLVMCAMGINRYDVEIHA
jgi:hypothetical protein